MIETRSIEERVHKSETSHLVVPEHLRPPICTEEAARIHNRVKRIHDPARIMVPYDVFEAESPIPPDRSMQFISYIDVLDDPLHAEDSQRGLIFRSEVDTSPTESVSNDIYKPGSIHTTTSPLIDTTTSSSIDK
ncbi:hypothetical protein DY000_02016116 [Brassica cretica]|uniref:Uncharacterized protein n=1 Tax=Brassica cretica TaxID=69181 RepID=A0ABQ7DBY3_BRACR|nr:hypothetical protein DY000_02016116 [Brassica cretica]